MSSPSGTERKKLVLVVDDDPTVRKMIARALEARSYEVREAGDGLAASELLGQMGRLPDLLICDVMMPLFDGFSLARLVKNRPELHTMPIIFLTAKAQPSDVATGISLGARYYVQKPFSVKDLLEKVDKTVR
jgi:DNA-binding response OmpR family regulator